ncbi:MAG: hypothetical protein LBB20_00615 [Puniceicoccales bacterium]|jgi:hypothetical protein|nr:hypothetical protein [Puniceicoccales bacterium]
MAKFNTRSFTILEILLASAIAVVISWLVGSGLNVAITAWRIKASIDKAHCDALLCLDKIEAAITDSTIPVPSCHVAHMALRYDNDGTSLSFCRQNNDFLSKMSLVEFKLAKLPQDYYYLMSKSAVLSSVMGIFMLRSELDAHNLTDGPHVLPSSKPNASRSANEKEDIYNLILPNVIDFQVSLCGLTNSVSATPELNYMDISLPPKHFNIEQATVFDSAGNEVVPDSMAGNPEPKFIDLMIETIPDILVNKYEKASPKMRRELLQKYVVRLNRLIRFR